jgi:protein-L-isoaspartate(D-aspartate) O-methyltransferase
MDVVSREIADDRVVEAFKQVARRDFVPEGSEREADEDRPVSLPHRQTTSQPSLIARMIEAACVGPEDRVLEIGTGYGFQTALLAVLAKEVVSVERYPALAERARDNLKEAGASNADVYVGDGWDGWPERSPYDAMVVSAAAAEIPRALVAQLRAGGRLVVPLKRGRSDDVVALVKGTGDDVIEERLITPARFVPLVKGRPDA